MLVLARTCEARGDAAGVKQSSLQTLPTSTISERKTVLQTATEVMLSFSTNAVFGRVGHLRLVNGSNLFYIRIMLMLGGGECRLRNASREVRYRRVRGERSRDLG